jgi:hypothetical protein
MLLVKHGAGLYDNNVERQMGTDNKDSCNKGVMAQEPLGTENF